MAFTPFVETDQPTMAGFNEKFLSCINDAVSRAPHIVSGSYIGTGQVGSSHPNTLIFSEFRPDIVIISAEASTNSREGAMAVFIWGNPTPGVFDLASGGILSAQYNDQTLSWYAISAIGYNGTDQAASQSTQLNRTGMTYRYVAIGGVVSST